MVILSYRIRTTYGQDANINLLYRRRSRTITGCQRRDRVYIFDTTLRDGEQSPGCSMTVTEKLRMAHKLADLGVDILEAGFPIASEGDFEAVRAVGREVAGARSPRSRAACRSTSSAPPRRWRQAAAPPRIHTFIATSDIHLKHKLKKTQRPGAGRGRRRASSWRASTSTTSSSRPKTARAPSRTTWSRSSRAVVAAGATHRQHPRHRRLLDARRVRRADRPRGRRRSATRGIVSVHCHDDLGLAVANSLAAVQAGARQIECTINGIGERAGNCSLEEIVMAIKTRHDRLPYETGINTEQLYPVQPAADLDHRRRRRSPTRRSSGATPSRTRPASTRTAS